MWVFLLEETTSARSDERFSSHSAAQMSQGGFSLLKGGISFIKQVKTSVR